MAQTFCCGVRAANRAMPDNIFGVPEYRKKN